MVRQVSFASARSNGTPAIWTNFLDHLGDAKDWPAADLKPYHVIEWIDAQTGWGRQLQPRRNRRRPADLQLGRRDGILACHTAEGHQEAAGEAPGDLHDA